MNALMHDTCFALCTGGGKFVMVSPEQKFCPSNVHTQIHTMIFRKFAMQSKTWCRCMNLKVCS